MEDRSSLISVLVRIAREALWAPVAVVVVHWVAGRQWGHEPYVDPVMHFMGGAAVAFFFLRAAECGRRYLGDLSLLARALLALGLSALAAVAWEFGEFLLDRYRWGPLQRGLTNTMRDLFLGVGGALLYIGTHAVFARRHDRAGARCTKDP
jgi:hypothetical protein